MVARGSGALGRVVDWGHAAKSEPRAIPGPTVRTAGDDPDQHRHSIGLLTDFNSTAYLYSFDAVLLVPSQEA
jgi:hypothetical protein